MINIIIYGAVLLMVFNILMIRKLSEKQKYSFDGIGVNVTTSSFKVPIITLIIVTFILSVYSTYLSSSGAFPDTERYAWSYLYRYPYYYDSLELMLSAGTEIGFLLLNMFMYSITEDPKWLFFIIAFLVTFINLYVATKISKSYALIILLYMISLYFFYSTFLLRQIISVSFINLAYLSYLNGKTFRYFMFCLIAFCFHVTAAIMFAFYFVFKNVKSKKHYIVLCVGSLFTFFLFSTVFNNLLSFFPYISSFLIEEGEELSFGAGSITSILKGLPFFFVTILALIKRNALKKIMKNADLFIICSVLYSTSWLLTYNMYWFFRVGLYFLLPTLILIPFLLKTIKNPHQKILYSCITIFLILIISIRQIYITLT